MIEDKLTRDQRIRLECLAQANMAASRSINVTAASVVDMAKKFETFVKRGAVDG